MHGTYVGVPVMSRHWDMYPPLELGLRNLHTQNLMTPYHHDTGHVSQQYMS